MYLVMHAYLLYIAGPQIFCVHKYNTNIVDVSIYIVVNINILDHIIKGYTESLVKKKGTQNHDCLCSL
jgi:hypothetical protein